MEDYVKIYDDCLTRKYHNEKLEPLIFYIQGIIICANGEILRECDHYDQNERLKNIKNYKTNFMKNILSIFNIIIDSNNYDNFEELLRFYCDLNLSMTQIYDYLCAIYDKKNFYKTRNFEYTFFFVELDNIIRLNKIKDQYDFNLYKMLMCYKKYSNMIANDKSLRRVAKLLDRYGPKIVSIYNLYDYDINDLDELFRDIINDPDKYISYFELNGVNTVSPYVLIQEKEAIIVENMVKNRFSEKRIIR